MGSDAAASRAGARAHCARRPEALRLRARRHSGIPREPRVPLPTVAAAGLIAVELLGGVALLIGAWTRVAAALPAADMLGAILTVHPRGGFFGPDGVEFVLTPLGGCLALVGLGAEPCSVDRARRG